MTGDAILLGLSVSAAALTQAPGLDLVERYGVLGLLAFGIWFGATKMHASLERNTEAVTRLAASIEGLVTAQEQAHKDIITGMEERTQRIMRAAAERPRESA